MAKKSAIKRVGKIAEMDFKNRLRYILNRDDKLINNVSLHYKNMMAEIDTLIINHNGILIIEVKKL